MAGVAVPGAADAARDDRDAPAGDHDRLRHDRGVAGHHDDAARLARWRSGRRRSARCCRSSKSRSSIPATGATSARRRARRAVLPRLQRDEGLLQQPRGDARGDRRRRLAAHRRRSQHGCRRLCPDHRPHQGHDHPRRREHRAEGDRGSPARAPGGRRRLRLRRGGRVLRRSGGGRGPAEAGRDAVPGRGADRVVRRRPREVQGAALRAVRRRSFR